MSLGGFMVKPPTETCECPEGCNGCERLSFTDLYNFIENQRLLWPKNSSEQWQIRAALNMLVEGLELFGGIRDPNK